MEYPFKDLLPLDEVLEREGYYKDWTHLDPEVFYSLTQISEMVKTKGFGVDVRLLISQLAEHFGLSVVEITDIANDLVTRQSAVEDRQDAVELFNNQVIQEMTDKDVISAPEIIQMRDGEATANDRIERDYTNLGQRIDYASVHKNAQQYGVVGDGVTDDTAALQGFLDLGGNLYIPSGTYLFDKISITKDDTTLIFGPSVKLISTNVDDSQTAGGIEVKGQVVHTINYPQSINKGSKSITTIQSSLFSEGDLVWVSQHFDHTVSGPSADKIVHEERYANVMLTVSHIDGEVVYFNEPFYHDFQESNYPEIKIVKPIKNTKILASGTEFSKNNTTSYCNHISIELTQGAHVSGFNFLNGGGKGIAVTSSYDFNLSDNKRRKPTNVEAGHGYGYIVSRSNKGTVTRCDTYDARHGVDVAWATYDVLVDDCKSYLADFNIHGQNSKEITFRNCVAFGEKSTFNVGNLSYGGDFNIRFIDCKVNDNVTGTAFSTSSFSGKVTFDRCESTSVRTGYSVSEESSNVNIIRPVIDKVYDAMRIKGKEVSIVEPTIKNFERHGILGESPDGLMVSKLNHSEQLVDGAIYLVTITGSYKDVDIDINNSVGNIQTYFNAAGDSALRLTFSVKAHSGGVHSGRAISIDPTAGSDIKMVDSKLINPTDLSTMVFFGAGLVDAKVIDSIVEFDVTPRVSECFVFQNSSLRNSDLSLANTLPKLLVTGNSFLNSQILNAPTQGGNVILSNNIGL